MMKPYYEKWAAAAVGTILLWCTSAAAGSWEVTQTATMGNGSDTTTLTQEDNETSTQAINAIMLGTADTVTSASQTVTVNGDFELIQGAGDNNRQAANLIEAGTIVSATQTFSADNVLLSRSAVGDNNLQALNMALATSDNANEITTLEQTVTIDQLEFRIVGGSHNIQAGNLARTHNTFGSITQTFTCAGTVTFGADTGTLNLQAGNAIILKNAGEALGTTVQVFSASNVVVPFSEANGSGGSIKVANYIGQAL